MEKTKANNVDVILIITMVINFKLMQKRRGFSFFGVFYTMLISYKNKLIQYYFFAICILFKIWFCNFEIYLIIVFSTF